jgi:3-mercaptopyruvate sulfurtransferase SseA
MRYILPLLMVVALVIGIACQNVSSTTKTETAVQSNIEVQEEAPRISLADAKSDFDAGKAIFVDSRPEDAYQAEHIKGAINVPLADAETKFKNIPTDKKIIIYCS